MIATIEPSPIKGTVTIPASKSAMQRACALALLNKGRTIIHNPGNSNDDLVAIDIIRELGAKVYFEKESLVIESNGEVKPVSNINCAESGLSFRMFVAIASLAKSTIIIDGSGSLLKRPLYFIDKVFAELNVTTTTNNGLLPVTVVGPLVPTDTIMDASSGSQYVTGLLFALASVTTKPVTLQVKNLKSKPYIDLSLQMLHHFGYKVRNESYTKFYIEPVEKKEQEIVYNTEADWSSASFLLAAAAIEGKVVLHGLDINSTQADRAILKVLKQTNADIIINEQEIIVSNKNTLKAFEFDATDCPDLFPPLTALAVYCKGVSVIKGVSRLTGKESNRALSLTEVFPKMGVEITVQADELRIVGSGVINSATVSSHNDHRIAMACAVAAVAAKGSITIEDAEAVNKSYPAFYEHLKMLGAAVSLQDH